MITCSNCRDCIQFFSGKFRNNDFSFNKNDLYIPSNNPCKTNFMDLDGRVKTCLEYYYEMLAKYIKAQGMIDDEKTLSL